MRSERFEENKDLFFFFRRFLYNNADKTESRRQPNITQRRKEREREMEVEFIMDGSKRKREHHQPLFLLSLSLNARKKRMMRKTKDDPLEGYYTAIRMCTTDDKCISS